MLNLDYTYIHVPRQAGPCSDPDQDRCRDYTGYRSTLLPVRDCSERTWKEERSGMLQLKERTEQLECSPRLLARLCACPSVPASAAAPAAASTSATAAAAAACRWRRLWVTDLRLCSKESIASLPSSCPPPPSCTEPCPCCRPLATGSLLGGTNGPRSSWSGFGAACLPLA